MEWRMTIHGLCKSSDGMQFEGVSMVTKYVRTRTSNGRVLRSRWVWALGLAMVGAIPGQAGAAALDLAQDEQGDTRRKQIAGDKAVKKLEGVTVTGSLIPQTQVETATPVITITAESLKARGFATVADALQQSSFATGSVQGSQSSASFTQGAQTLSLFGMPPGFTKYLVDGRPMGNFPALYNGSETFNNLSGIPIQMVDRIEILPGGQSSLYGSDAIAGVINIILKKKLDAPVLDVRYGFYQGGGGATRRLSLADSFHVGKLHLMGGLQYEKTDPIWGYDRDLTSHYNRHGTRAPVASRDYLVYSGVTGRYVDPKLLDPAGNCGNVTSQFAGTEGYRTRPGSGGYCGSFDSPGYRTIDNGSENAQLYTHANYDVDESLQFYGDLLYNYNETKYAAGSGYTWWGSSRKYGYFYDPDLKDYVQLQRAFSPEDVGGYRSIMRKDVENAYMLTLGAKGRLGSSNWDWDLGFTHSDDKLTNRGFARWSDAIEDYFALRVLGPNLGPAPNPRYSVFRPDYAAFYSVMSPTDFNSFTGFTTTRSKTWDNMLRGQLTNASLFSLPGGDAGIAAVLEGGNQGWDYTPDARLIDGGVWGTTSVQGSGHRSRYAGTVEFRAPLLNQLTLDVSGRYDDFKVAGKNVNKATYSLGLEYRPFETLLLRGKYGTAFKVPTLSDQFQGLSGFYSSTVDYYNCAVLGYRGSNIDSCPARYSNVQYFGQQSGNPDLKPISAKVWSTGLVWSPLQRMAVSLDYLHWNIEGEVRAQKTSSLLRDEMLCRLGEHDPQSPSCVAALNQVTRASSSVAGNGTIGGIQTIYTPKMNVAKRTVAALMADFKYVVGIGRYGDLSFNASYNNMLKHEYTQYVGDPVADRLRDPTWSTDFKTRVNASVGWGHGPWASTLYVNRYGKTPNYLAEQNGYGYPGAGKLKPWIRYNGSVSYQANSSLQLSLMLNNILNKMPPRDNSYPGTSSSPYNSQNYDVYGRAYYLQVTYKFGEARS